MTRRFLARHGIDYEERDVDIEANTRELVEKTGQLSIPVTFIGEHMISGYNEPELRRVLQAEGVEIEAN